MASGQLRATREAGSGLRVRALRALQTGRGKEGSGILRFALNDTGTGGGEERRARVQERSTVSVLDPTLQSASNF